MNLVDIIMNEPCRKERRNPALPYHGIKPKDHAAQTEFGTELHGRVAYK